MLKNFHISKNEIGTDEAGRGCLAGPVTAAAVVLPEKFKNSLLNDSKKISEIKRFTLKPIIEDLALCYAVTHIEPLIIDDINILNASILAMQKSVLKLDTAARHIIVDGNRFKPMENYTYDCIIKGDGKYMSIAAASILAKTYRDEVMNLLHEEFPMYNWKQNKGYPTKEHRAAIRKYGITKYHRKSFKQLPEQLELKI
ncbi:ribonuclease HII [Cellulophaga sp. HaHa_2_95]|jgi:ribonuclease HII|uniref:ribonuclease HII n=1 Tax=Cellulophaga TaxID=104264 RepID=UPI001C4F2965|nr:MULTISPECIES: ribonuclease HII [unclassified Cellulophaga]QXP50483.1 ribonuclease HII [Cellulophaga sp. HaHa_2_1]QXP57206.1 ribonuclease HII [Cellulophaga sp. HaHa_2_95]